VYRHKEREEERPTNSRSWTLQEKLLSPRLLIFGPRRLEWRCIEGAKCNGIRARDIVSMQRENQLSLFEKFIFTSRYGTTAQLWQYLTNNGLALVIKLFYKLGLIHTVLILFTKDSLRTTLQDCGRLQLMNLSPAISRCHPTGCLLSLELLKLFTIERWVATWHVFLWLS
jgi:hypothetical protein